MGVDLSTFDGIEAAPRGASRRNILDAQTLVKELALGTLALILDGKAVHTEAVKGVRPLLAASYTQAHSVVPSYLGAGRSADGLRLWRGAKSKAYSVSRENGALALRKLAELGVDLNAVAEELGLDDAEALVTAVDALPSHVG